MTPASGAWAVASAHKLFAGRNGKCQGFLKASTWAPCRDKMESVYSGTEMCHRVRSSDALKNPRVRREFQIYIISWPPHHPNCEKSSLALSLVVSNCSLSIQQPIAPIRLLAAFFSSCTQHAIFLFRVAAPLGPRLTCFGCMRQAVQVWRPPTDHRPYRRTSRQRGDVQRRSVLVRLRAAAAVIRAQ